MSGSQWLPQAELEKGLVENIEEIEYDNFVNAMTRLSSLPYSYRVKDFIYAYRKPLISDSHINEIPKAQYDDKGRQVITTYGESIKETSLLNNIIIQSPSFLQNV